MTRRYLSSLLPDCDKPNDCNNYPFRDLDNVYFLLSKSCDGIVSCLDDKTLGGE